MNVGFVGLGIMGRPMALNLIKAGHALRVHGRRPESMQPLEQAGFKAKRHHKDLRIVTETAAQLGIGLPQSALIALASECFSGDGLRRRGFGRSGEGDRDARCEPIRGLD
jgi:2-hydroxy-3-oxopropionate reductase